MARFVIHPWTLIRRENRVPLVPRRRKLSTRHARHNAWLWYSDRSLILRNHKLRVMPPPLVARSPKWHKAHCRLTRFASAERDRDRARQDMASLQEGETLHVWPATEYGAVRCLRQIAILKEQQRQKHRHNAVDQAVQPCPTEIFQENNLPRRDRRFHIEMVQHG